MLAIRDCVESDSELDSTASDSIAMDQIHPTATEPTGDCPVFGHIADCAQVLQVQGGINEADA